MTSGLAEHGGHDPLGGTPHQLHGERAADAVAHKEKLLNAEMVHQPELVVGEGAPRIVDGDRAGRFPVIGIALVHRDAAEVAFELLGSVEHRSLPLSDARVQTTTRGDQQREAGAGLLIANPDIALFIE
jgi:hypothetical protein